EVIERQLAFKNALSSRLLAAAPEESLRAGIDYVGRYFDVARLGIGEYDPDSGIPSIHYEYTDGTLPARAGVQLATVSSGPVAEDINAGRTVVIEDGKTDLRIAVHSRD